jgi:hypothetical protein
MQQGRGASDARGKRQKREERQAKGKRQLAREKRQTSKLMTAHAIAGVRVHEECDVGVEHDATTVLPHLWVRREW